jgi:hypothetical protein
VTITVVAGQIEQRGRPGEKSRQTLTQSTATHYQNVDLFSHSIVMGVGTATGFTINRYRLASDAVEAQQISLYVTGTGEANLLIQASTATGHYVFTEPDDYIACQHFNGRWFVHYTSATLASST